MDDDTKLPLLARKIVGYLGYDDADIAALRTVIYNRLKDARAFCHGGEMSDGTQIPGMAAVYQTFERLEKGLLALDRLLAKYDVVDAEEVPE